MHARRHSVNIHVPIPVEFLYMYRYICYSSLFKFFKDLCIKYFNKLLERNIYALYVTVTMYVLVSICILTSLCIYTVLCPFNFYVNMLGWVLTCIAYMYTNQKLILTVTYTYITYHKSEASRYWFKV